MTRARLPYEDSLIFKTSVLVTVVLLHLLAYRILGDAQRPAWRSAAGDSVLRVEFVVRTPPPAPAAPLPAPVRRAPSMPVRRTPASPAAPEAAEASAGPPPEPTAGPADEPLALDWQPPASDQPGYRPNLPESEVAFPSDLQEPDRLRARRQISGQDVVEGAAQLLGFWPPGYESDPCPRVERNIADLMTDTRPAGRRALGVELRRQRVACRR